MEKTSGGSFARTTRKTAEDEEEDEDEEEEEDRDMTLNTYKSRAFVRDFFSGVVIRSRAQAICPGGKTSVGQEQLFFRFVKRLR
jgi:hypothetical protein